MCADLMIRTLFLQKIIDMEMINELTKINDNDNIFLKVSLSTLGFASLEFSLERVSHIF